MAQAVAAVVEAAVDALSVARASVWMLSDARDAIYCRDLFDAGARRHVSGAVLHAAQFPEYFAALETDKLIVADDARLDPRTCGFENGYLDVNGIGAILDAPVRVGGRCVGVLCHEHVGGARTWSVDDQAAASYLASLLSLALEIERRREGERLLAESLSLLQVTMEAIGEGILAVNRNGSVVAWNRRFVEMWAIDEALLSTAGDGGPRLHALANQTFDPASYIRRARGIFDTPDLEAVDTIELRDGRVFERTSRPQLAHGAIVGRVWSFRDVTTQKRTEEALRQAEAKQRELATSDSLTGLANRRCVLEVLDRETIRACRTGRPLSAALLDLDNFKRINDDYGHGMGDEVLQQLAEDLRGRLRRTDTVGRYGGEEFLVLLPETDGATAVRLLDQIRAHVARPRERVPVFTMSGGVAEFVPDTMSASDLVDAADAKLYLAKRRGRNRVC